MVFDLAMKPVFGRIHLIVRYAFRDGYEILVGKRRSLQFNVNPPAGVVTGFYSDTLRVFPLVIAVIPEPVLNVL